MGYIFSFNSKMDFKKNALYYWKARKNLTYSSEYYFKICRLILKDKN